MYDLKKTLSAEFSGGFPDCSSVGRCGRGGLMAVLSPLSAGPPVSVSPPDQPVITDKNTHPVLS